MIYIYILDSAAEIPYGYRLQFLHGFVEELVVNDDPEYQWIDKIRTPRSSNEARQRLFSKMSGIYVQSTLVTSNSKGLDKISRVISSSR